jgi:hypothetical protein
MNVKSACLFENYADLTNELQKEFGYLNQVSAEGWTSGKSVSFNIVNDTDLKFTVNFKLLKKNAVVSAYFSYPCVGFVTQNNKVSVLKKESYEIDRVDQNSNIIFSLRYAKKLMEKNQQGIQELLGEEAKANERAKSLYLSTI